MAEQDLVERSRYFSAAEGIDPADRFSTAAIEAVRSVEDMPGAGSTLVGERIGIPELCCVGVEGFPCAWFYSERADHLEVIRLLADTQDLDDLLGGES